MIQERKIPNGIIVKPPPPLVQLANLALPSNPFFKTSYPNCLIVGMKGSGKTNLISTMLDELVDKNTAIICFGDTLDVGAGWQAISDKFGKQMIKHKCIYYKDKKSGKVVNHLEGFMERMGKPERKNENFNYIVIFDDISDQLRDPSVRTFLRHNRHYKCISIISTHGAVDVLPGGLSQINGCILLKGNGEQSLEHIHGKMSLGMDKNEFIELYKKATDKDYSFLSVDTSDGSCRKGFDVELKYVPFENIPVIVESDDSEPDVQYDSYSESESDD